MWIAGGLLLASVIAGTLAPQSRLWAVHFLAYYSSGGQGLFALAALFGAAVVYWFSRKQTAPAKSLAPSWGWQAALALAFSALAFVLLSAAVAILGDGQLWVNNVEAGAYTFSATRAPLTLLLHHGLYQWLHPLSGISGQHTFALVAVASGLATLGAWLCLARALRQSVGVTLLLGFSWGGSALFFGYVETYAVVVAALSWQAVLIYLAVRRDRFSWLPVSIGLLAPLLNLLAVVFLPTLAAYVYWGLTRRDLEPRKVLLWSLPGLGIAAILYFVLGWYRGTDVLLPLFATREHTGALLTLRQGIDLTNALLFVCGPLLLLFAVALAQFRRSAAKTQRSLLLLALLFPLAALVMHNPQLGMARDWDIAASLLVLVPVAALVLWSDLALSPGVRRALKIGCVLWLALVTLPWIRVQHSEELALRRFMDLLALDPDRAETGWDYLSSYYLHHGKTEEWGRCNRELLKRSDNPRYHGNLVLYYVLAGNWTDAREHARAAARAVAADSVVSPWETGITNPGTLLELGRDYARTARIQDAANTFAVAAELAPRSALPPAALLNLLVFIRDLNRASVVAVDLAQRDSTQTAEAREFFRPLTAVTDSYQRASAWLCLSLLAAAGQDIPTAVMQAQTALNLTPADTAAQAYLSRLTPLPR